MIPLRLKVGSTGGDGRGRLLILSASSRRVFWRIPGARVGGPRSCGTTWPSDGRARDWRTPRSGWGITRVKGRVALGSVERNLLRTDELQQPVVDPAAAPQAPRFPRKPTRIALPNQIFGRLTAASPPLKRRLWRYWYDFLAARYRQADWTFMNYGYAASSAAAELPLAGPDEANRYSIQLYEHVTSPISLRGARVLEVGCGRGGGCSYIARYREPASVLGVDFSAKAIAFCRRVHSVPDLTFQQGDAEALPCQPGAFDVVINVESSHCYGSMSAFLSEVFRALQPGGYFLWADLRPEKRLAETRRQFEAAGFQLHGESLISANVLRALDLISERKREMIRRLAPPLLVPCVEDFAGVKGTRVYESLRTGAIQYVSGVFQKPGSPLQR
jgi:SAM-dependent methyltransferase